ncbi:MULTISPECIES: SirB2 family protein [unclassified Acinetobacter]|uniref:SirB2 family protein n=1 Tax=unclassified Acinetobacter TaxID=196816 RepID=UPI00103AEB26|nr:MULTISPECIES: SirB2 family protein [unclassified Acinetobacter]TCB28459.1 hypothetical protein E0H86_11655 [Acinetobacter sp. ANC 4635]TCB84975.1 hypothetical protein E0H90_07375 [Acinetobacter sp. ANC 3791]
MNTLLLLKILHGVGVVLLLLMLALSSRHLFRMQDEQLAAKTPRLVIALQHSTFTLMLLTGGALLWMKHFQVQPWFYAKAALFVVIFSSLIKAFRRKEGILLVQRRAGIVIAWIALFAILLLVKIKPVFS